MVKTVALNRCRYKDVTCSAYMVFDRAAMLRIMVVVLFMLMAVDNVLTYGGVQYLHGIEGNPLCAYLGLDAFIGLKLVLMILIPSAIYLLGKDCISAGLSCCAFMNLLYAIIAVNNVIRLGLVG